MNRFLLAAQLAALCLLVINLDVVSAHGRLMDPVSRGARWRTDPTATPDYNDNEQFCGGLPVQIKNGGKCGLCGDNWTDKTPRAHELGGKFGQGVLVRNYKEGQVIPISVELTQNHKGHFSFKLCNLDKSHESENCFKPISISTGGLNYNLPSTNNGFFNLGVKLPANETCKHCVLQWTYTSGNNWGQCPDGSSGSGCGPQETFVNCADISISANKSFLFGEDMLDVLEDVSEE